ncbi:Cof-type HAD-IIB family hydrolase [Listeria booriae]|uniref:Cof-type HAD-IIB family hydrolase n=1 Tax=Listeria booriae TaxID=1552123 RepID=A0A7X1D8C6_9LIST|nr:Cof-type HAD-IIB family hydrolase [Listeria booriae]MBC2176513.1 Cof-type HAD-IIB family hydrolase [Listeria booriae]
MKPAAICFFDLDGTLLTSDSVVAPSSVQALQALRAKNIMPIIATGRTLCEIEHVLEATKMTSVIAMNGQYVMYDGKEVYTNPIDVAEIKALHEGAQSQGVEMAFYTEAKIRATAQNEIMEKHYRYLGEASPEIDAELYLKEPIYMLLLLLEQGDDFFPERYPYFQFVRNTPFSNDVVPKGGSKARGIAKLLEVMGFEDVPTYAFGDGMNDLEMFEAVDYAIAMDNAVPALKEKAAFITANNNEDGIAKGLGLCGLLE